MLGEATGSAPPAPSCCVKQGGGGVGANSFRPGTSFLLFVLKQKRMTFVLSLSKG